MKKLALASFAVLALLVSGVAEAGGGHGKGGGGGSGRGGYGGGHGHGGGGYSRGGHGGRRGGYRGYRGYGGGYRGHRGYSRAGWGWGGGVAIYPRVGIGWPGPYWWGSPYLYYGAGYPYYGYGVPYAAPYYQRPIIVQPAQPQVYVEQARPAPQYWHYCEDPKGYYPYVEKCRGEWLQVVPRTESPE